LTLPKQTLEG